MHISPADNTSRHLFLQERETSSAVMPNIHVISFRGLCKTEEIVQAFQTRLVSSQIMTQSMWT